MNVKAKRSAGSRSTTLCTKWKSEDELLTLYDSVFIRPHRGRGAVALEKGGQTEGL